MRRLKRQQGWEQVGDVKPIAYVSSERKRYVKA